MSLRACLPGLVAEGKLSPELAEDAGVRFDAARAAFARQVGDDAADALASDAVLKALASEGARRRFLAGLTVKARGRMEADIGGYDGGAGGAGGKPPGGPSTGSGGAGSGGPVDPRAAAALIARDERSRAFSADGRRRAIERRAFARMGQMLKRFHSDLLGRVRHIEELRLVVREIFGEDTGNLAAKEMAQAWLASAEELRVRFNAAGGAIGRLRDGKGYLPQIHDALRVRKAGFQAWRAAIVGKLDRAAMLDRDTGLPLDDTALDTLLAEVFQTIRSEGWFKRSEGGGAGIGAVANRRGDPRVLVFKDAKSWIEYDAQFGKGDPFAAMIAHVRGMARDTAAMERFGPNPEAGVQWLKDRVAKSAAEDAAPDAKAVERAATGVDRIETYWAHYTGADQAASRAWLARVGTEVRAFAVAGKMGSAIVSAGPGDVGTQHVAAAFNGLPVTRTLAEYTRQLDPTNAGHRQLAAELGLVYEGWIHNLAAQSRLLGDEVQVGTMSRVAEGVLRAQGLNWWTDAGNAAFGVNVFTELATQRGKAWGELDGEFRGMLERGGIDAARWDAVRATPVQNRNGVKLLFAQDVADRELGDALLEMVAFEQQRAVQVADFETRATLAARFRPGTVIGELGKTALLFKSFGLSMLFMHGRRALARPTAAGAAGYALRIATTLTLAGAVSLQLREIAKGNDPRSMADGSFWLAAAWQGGGFGMIADLLKLTTDPRMNTFAEFLAGPVFGDTMTNAISLGNAAVRSVAGDEKANPGRALVKSIRSDLPGGNLWYTRLALQRMLTDQLQEEIDPRYRESWRAMDRRLAEQGQGQWWASGEVAPERAPDLSNIFAGEPANSEQGSLLQ